MRPLIGVLLNKRILQRNVRGAPTFEKLSLYAKAAKELGVDVVFFETAGVQMKGRQVIGYVPAAKGGFKKRVVPLPKVVHKRGLFRRASDRRVIKRLEEERVYLFNPEISWDKYDIYTLLAKEPRLLPHLPKTVSACQESFPWFEKQLSEGCEVFVKPRKGSLGLGVARVYRLGPGRYCYESRRVRKKTTLRGVWNLALRKGDTCMLQAGIRLMEDEGRRVDFRVPVQRDGENRWRIPGFAAKRAEKLSFLTNLARGGSVHDGRQMLARNFGDARAREIADEMLRISVLAAETLNARHPRLVDFGLDIGVDQQGRPHIIEVNRRDLRVLLERSGQSDANAALYKNPIAYGRYLLESEAQVQRAVAN